MMDNEEKRLIKLEKTAPENIWIPDRGRRSPEAYMRDMDDFHLSIRMDPDNYLYRAEVVERQNRNARVWWGKDFQTRFAACHAATRKAQEQMDPSLPRTSRILTRNQKAVDETEPAYVIGQAVLNMSMGDELNQWIGKLTDGAPTIYDRAMDSVYNTTHVGGNLHRQFDGGHTIIGAFQAARYASPNDSILQELAGTAKGLLKDSATSRGLPFATWTPDIYFRAAQAVEKHLLIPKKTFYSMTSWNVPKALSAGIGLAELAMHWKSRDVRKLGEIAGRLITSATVFKNGVLLLVALPALGKAVFEGARQNRLGELVGSLAEAGINVGIMVAIMALTSSVAAAVLGPGIVPQLVAIAATWGIAKLAQTAMESTIGKAVARTTRAAVRKVTESRPVQFAKRVAISFWSWLKGVAASIFGGDRPRTVFA